MIYRTLGFLSFRGVPWSSIIADRDPRCCADEGTYQLSHGERGSKVVFVVSEPITASTSDWVSVPRNSALVVSRGKGGYINVIQTPLAAGGKHLRQAEVQLCVPPHPNSK